MFILFLLLFSIVSISLISRIIEENRERDSCKDNWENKEYRENKERRREFRNIKRERSMDNGYMKDTVKLFNWILFGLYLVGIVLALIFKNNSTVRIGLGIALAIKATLFSLTNQSLDEETKSYTLGVLDILLLSPITGIIYLCWMPKGNKVFY